MLRMITNRLFIANSRLDPAGIGDSNVSMVVFLITGGNEARAVDSFIKNGYFIKQHQVGNKDDARELAKLYSFTVSSGDNVLVVCDDLTYTREFVVDVLNNACGLAFADGADLFYKKLKA